MESHFTGPGTRPGLNDYLKEERKFPRRGGTAHSCGNDRNQENRMFICNEIRRQLKRLKIQRPVHISYRFYEPNRRRDLDNIAGVAHKFIQDSLVRCGVLENDGWDQITGFSDAFFVDLHNPRIEITIREVEPDAHN